MKRGEGYMGNVYDNKEMERDYRMMMKEAK